jgi:hypothetical protein
MDSHQNVCPSRRLAEIHFGWPPHFTDIHDGNTKQYQKQYSNIPLPIKHA